MDLRAILGAMTGILQLTNASQVCTDEAGRYRRASPGLYLPHPPHVMHVYAFYL